ncbi:hypothetical protein HJC23_011100 [Cyclotella cryptica]|uniref:Uncharacterized protein n=1 Tax=Cyclotella cryptica TaxID=29204 RepID=A0ABD3P7K4_9STRA
MKPVTWLRRGSSSAFLANLKQIRSGRGCIERKKRGNREEYRDKIKDLGRHRGLYHRESRQRCIHCCVVQIARMDNELSRFVPIILHDRDNNAAYRAAHSEMPKGEIVTLSPHGRYKRFRSSKGNPSTFNA